MQGGSPPAILSTSVSGHGMAIHSDRQFGFENYKLVLVFSKERKTKKCQQGNEQGIEPGFSDPKVT